MQIGIFGAEEIRKRRGGREMINKQLLKSKMILREITQPQIAKKLGLSITSINQKINGNIIFKPKEIKEIRNLLGLSNDETVEIFLS